MSILGLSKVFRKKTFPMKYEITVPIGERGNLKTKQHLTKDVTYIISLISFFMLTVINRDT